MGLKTCETCRSLEYSAGKFSCTEGVDKEDHDRWEDDCDLYYFDESYP